jgi:eukaryotic-like serine/threonine-protein kinase
MIASEKSFRQASDADAALGPLVEELTRLLQAGQCVDWEEYLRDHAEHAEALRPLIPAIQALADLGGSTPEGVGSSPVSVDQAGLPAGVLGDFRILREIGRGGMGVVYEAEQISLGRRVALKVLPFASTLDPRQLQRFKNEAQAAAHLHHTNIVPVHATGCERGVHYYAMQFIEGRTLAAVIQELRRCQKDVECRMKNVETRTKDAPSVSTFDILHSSFPIPPGETASADWSTKSHAFFRTIARLGIQAAQALEHAHQLGIVHRDIKPANLLVDARGNLWVTDFGLAQILGDTKLTMTRDLLGTLRYMSPEQASARRAVVDHRTDVYSLGLTLYELLALQPAFNSRDRQELLYQIDFEEPRPPRRFNRAIPPELETIVLKAAEKNPADRYATAQELADDLERYLRDEPIRARRPTLRHRAKKWARRHRAIVWSVAVCLLPALVIATGSIGWMMRDRAVRMAMTQEKVNVALKDATELQSRSMWPEALEAVKRAEGFLAGGGSRELADRVRDLRKDLEMVLSLEKIRFPRAFRTGEGRYDDRWATLSYFKAFREYGIDLGSLEPLVAAECIRARSIRLELAMALDNWASLSRARSSGGDAGWKQPLAASPSIFPPTFPGRGGNVGWKQVLAVARAADPDEWRNQLRDALEHDRTDALVKLAASEKIRGLPLQTLTLLAAGLKDKEKELAVLRQAQRTYPGDHWINFKLAYALMFSEPPLQQLDDAVRFYTAALAIRPRNVPTHFYLAEALRRCGKHDEAIALYRRAADLNSDDYGLNSMVYNNLAWLLATCPHAELRNASQAVELATEAVGLAPEYPLFWNTLGVAQYRAGNIEAALVALENSMRFRDDGDSSDWYFLAMAHWRRGDQQEARRWYDRAVRWMEQHRPKDDELRAFRTEAAELLGVKEIRK